MDDATVIDFKMLRRDLGRLMRSDPTHDDGSLGPLFVRLTWHCCGTYDIASGTGGSDGGTMRFSTEQADPENAGLEKARALLEQVKSKHPGISRADLYVLAGYVALEVAGGPEVPFRRGRRDVPFEEAQAAFLPLHGKSSGCPFGDGRFNPCGSRLPAADLGVDEAAAAREAPVEECEARTIAAMRGTFARLGFDDRETVLLLILGHNIGRCHPGVSGFDGAW